MTLPLFALAAALAAEPVPTPSGPVATADAQAVQTPPPLAEANPAKTEDQRVITVTGRGPPPKSDPLQGVNATSFAVVQATDRAVVAPVTHAYMKLPSPVQSGVHNVLFNMEEPVHAVNFLLQHRIGKAAGSLTRLAINSTIGLGGLIDVAKRKPIGLKPRKNGFANTLGFYGVGAGPYLFLPLIGSTSLRDLPGRMLDLSFLPSVVGVPFKGAAYTFGRGVAASIDDRAALDPVLNQMRDADGDQYTSMRKYYLAKRKAEVAALHGPDAGLVVAPTAPAPKPKP